MLSRSRRVRLSFASKKFASDVLNQQLQPLGSHDPLVARSPSGKQQILGSIEVLWRLAEARETIHGPVRLFITSEENAPYDIVLGKGSTK